MGNKTLKLPEGDWPVSFEAVRLAQHLRFRALSAREKIQTMENMAEVVKAAEAARERSRKAAQSNKK